jgi:glycosyltransferase involved in cell wall biosynthesis
MGNAIYTPLARLLNQKVIVYMDGIDWERPKWGALARFILKKSASIALNWANAVYVDNQTTCDQFKTLFGKSAEVITLAAEKWQNPGKDLLHQYGLESEKYILFVGFLKPDKGVHVLIEAFLGLEGNIQLVLVGDNPDSGTYLKKIRNNSDKRIKFLGYVYGSAVQQLFANCLIYVQPSIIEGNSPSLMSAMACGRFVVVSDIKQNMETIGDAGASFRCGDALSLRQVLKKSLDNPERMRVLGRLAKERIESKFSWENVINKLERLYQRINDGKNISS